MTTLLRTKIGLGIGGLIMLASGLIYNFYHISAWMAFLILVAGGIIGIIFLYFEPSEIPKESQEVKNE